MLASGLSSVIAWHQRQETGARPGTGEGNAMSKTAGKDEKKTCYIVVKQGYFGNIRNACGYCDVTIPNRSACCPGCGRRVMGR